MKSKWVTIQLGYVLGASALLTAIVYFFATNWEVLSRWEKLVPALLLIAGFYGCSVWLSRLNGRQFLSRLSLLASCVSFGVAVALIGQTYNSHADSYGLFAVWALPALFFAALTRWQPFYVLTYVLGHIAYLLYFFPRWDSGPGTEGVEIVIWLGLVAANAVIYGSCQLGKLRSSVLRWISFQTGIGVLLWVSNSQAFEHAGIWMNVPLVIVLAAAVLYAHRKRDKMYLLFAGLWVSAAVTLKYIELVIEYHNELFFIISLVFLILFIYGNVKFMNYIRSWHPAGTDRDQDQEDKQDGHFSKWVVRVLTVAVVIIGSLLGCVTIIGIVTVVLRIDKPEYVLIGFGILAVLAMIAAKPLNVLARYTVLISGLLLGAGAAAVKTSIPLLLVFLALALIAFARMEGVAQRVFFLLAAEVITIFVLANWLEDGAVITLIATVLFLAAFAAGQWLTTRASLRQPLQYGSYPSFLAAFFALTFITEGVWYYISNGLFFILIVVVMFLARQDQAAWLFRFALGFWVAFLLYKYYDLAWKLLHKSISFAIVGVLILTITMWVEQKQRQQAGDHLDTGSYYGSKRWLIALLVVLELSAASLQIGKSEWQLAHGKIIKLQLAPLDPRSLLQGDYVRLRYEISQPPQIADDDGSKEKITVVLAPNAATGVYEFNRIYTPGEALGADEVRLNGKKTGFRGIEYGIESYFFPEGTGRVYEQNAKFAEVNVSSGGDGMLVKLLLSKN